MEWLTRATFPTHHSDIRRSRCSRRDCSPVARKPQLSTGSSGCCRSRCIECENVLAGVTGIDAVNAGVGFRGKPVTVEALGRLLQRERFLRLAPPPVAPRTVCEVSPRDLCHKRAIRFGSLCAKTSLFVTCRKCFRAGVPPISTRHTRVTY